MTNQPLALEPKSKSMMIPIIILMLWFTHAVCFFAHEYSHSFSAWAFGYKDNPLALNYGDWSIINMLVQLKINENVDYRPIIADGHYWFVAWIAFAGILMGNGLFYLVCRRLWSISRRNNRPYRLLFFFWICVMSIGSFFSYIPLRTFSPIGDMSKVENALDISPWILIGFPGLLVVWALWHLLTKLLPRTISAVFPADLFMQRLHIILCVFEIFVFCGLAGIVEDNGKISYWLCLSSVFGLFPMLTFLCWRSQKAVS